jgi:glucan phosphoethanolaminetransferase (alkaline phosphatase superfamily)
LAAVRLSTEHESGVLVDTVKEMLLQHGAKQEKMFFVIHTLGSHFNMTSRYPRTFDVFPDDDSRLSDQARLINAYDNTIVYTDHVLAELIEVVRARPGFKALLYVADHGENLKDDDRGLFGHYQNNEYDLPIPMLFWYSREFEWSRESRPHSTSISEGARGVSGCLMPSTMTPRWTATERRATKAPAHSLDAIVKSPSE